MQLKPEMFVEEMRIADRPGICNITIVAKAKDFT
jgi:hypothetical protein